MVSEYGWMEIALLVGIPIVAFFAVIALLAAHSNELDKKGTSKWNTRTGVALRWPYVIATDILFAIALWGGLSK